MKVLIRFFCIVLLFSQTLTIYSQLIPIPLEQKIGQSELIVEGKVVGQISYTAPNGEIYTENEIEVLNFVKGISQAQTLSVITMGGKTERYEVTWSHLAKLNLNQYGIFFLVRTERPTRENNRTSYEIYSSSQGFYQVFRDDNGYRVISPLDRYDEPGEFYQKLGIEHSAIHGTFTDYLLSDKNCIIYKIVPRIPTNLQSSTMVEADILVKAEEWTYPLYKANLVVKYSEEIFGQNIVTSGNLTYTDGELVTSSYSLSFSDYSVNQLEVKLDANTTNVALLEEIGTEFKKIATIEVNVIGWSNEPPLEWNPNDATITNQYVEPQTNLIKEFECTDVIFEEQGGIDVTGFEPNIAAAGVSIMSANPMPFPGVVTIMGTGFSDPEPGEIIPDGHRVKFETLGGGWIAPFEGDYISWTDEEIRVKVPSIGYDNNSDDIITDFNSDIACTGRIRVCQDGLFACGMNDDTDDDLYIPFSARTTVQVNGDGIRESVRTTLLDFTDGGYSIRFNPNFTALAVDAYKRALTTWRCETRVNFDADDVNPPITGDGFCRVRFSDLPIGVGSTTRGRTLFSPDDCGDEPNIDFSFIRDFQMQFNENIDWHTGEDMPGGLNWDDIGAGTLQADLESTALHEIGHAHLLNHTCNAANVMIAPGPSEFRRNLTNDDEDGGNHISLLSNGIADLECPATGMELIDLAECDITPVIEIEGKSIDVILFPNPTRERIKINFETPLIIDGIINVFDASGKTVMSLNTESNSCNINVINLSKGVYHVLYIDASGKQFFVGKFSKK